MAYSELVKNFERIRDYMREFYVYGFKTRMKYDGKSARSYDNERRRLESWLGDYMRFQRDAGGKSVFLSVDSRSVSHNPLHKAFKAKSFTDADITLHFIILDILQPGEVLSTHELLEQIQEYLFGFDRPMELDDSTIRKKLKEYERLGLLESRRHGKELMYCRTEDGVDLSAWRDAAEFYAETDPLGVVGAYLLDKYEGSGESFRFKHHYILHALDSEILAQLLECIAQRRSVDVTMAATRKDRITNGPVCPLRIMVSTQTGRQYLLCYKYESGKFTFLRLDYIHCVTAGETEPEFEQLLGAADAYRGKVWGVSSVQGAEPEHIEMIVRVEAGEQYIAERLEREKRCGRVERLDDKRYRFTAEVYDAVEMLPWLRTFTGRVEQLRCSNPEVTERFYANLKELWSMYGGEADGIQ